MFERFDDRNAHEPAIDKSRVPQFRCVSRLFCARNALSLRARASAEIPPVLESPALRESRFHTLGPNGRDGSKLAVPNRRAARGRLSPHRRGRVRTDSPVEGGGVPARG
jgi:hypothetical protein